MQKSLKYPTLQMNSFQRRKAIMKIADVKLLSRTLRAETSLFDADVSSLSLATRESSVVLKISISACVFQAVGLSSLAELKEKNPQFLDLWLRYYAKYSQQVNKKIKKKELEAKLLIGFNTFGKVSTF